MITLYDYELSGNCYKLRLMMSILRLRYEVVAVDYYPGNDTQSDWFLKLNPLGELPVLVDDGRVFTEATLAWLARKYDASGRWLPVDDPALVAEVMTWTSFAARLSEASGGARLAIAFEHDIDLSRAQAEAHRLFRVMDEHLWFGEKEGRDWLASADHPTIADIACFPHTALSEEGGISRQDYPAIRRWLDRVRRIEGFAVMSGVFPASRAREVS
ncbi:glutathione S-transferase [Devosia geojensis]|uniref:Glutathione S-transferase n=1 Tax=Devosia geojensis TaxID=443610 RepID=A0A0F5FHR8_9HYPH|nr:glutathione S-transferase [Devosia geojensis]KKB08401.1 glutathione S-transferase [Devosia geojensis]